MKLKATGETVRSYILTWKVGENPLEQAFATRGDLFAVIRALTRAGVLEYTIIRHADTPLAIV